VELVGGLSKPVMRDIREDVTLEKHDDVRKALSRQDDYQV
jgi:hypothetical protein